MLTFTLCSELHAPPADVWAHCSSLAGINEELAPLRMTAPPTVATLGPEDVPLHRTWFHSWVLLFGVIPLDRHALRLTELVPGEGFHEESTSWLQRRWIHDRRVTPTPAGCKLTDQVCFEPRLALLRPLLVPIVRATFARRHRRLQARFGTRSM